MFELVWKTAWYTVFVLLCLAGIAAVVALSGRLSSTELGIERRAWAMTQEIVKDQLRSPASATFPPYEYQVIQTDLGEYIVISYVDSQNGFGALIRTHFVCELKATGRGQWEVVSLDFSEH